MQKFLDIFISVIVIAYFFLVTASLVAWIVGLLV